MSSDPKPPPDGAGSSSAPVLSVAAAAFEQALATLTAGVDLLAAVDLTGMTDVEVEDALRAFTTETRRTPVVRNALVAEVIERHLPALRRCSSTAAYLRNLIRVPAAEGKALERDALDLVPGRSLSTGEELPPRFGVVATAVSHGQLSTTAARMITTTLRLAPAGVSPDDLLRAELRLVRCATRFEPATLRRRCQEELDRLDPDGRLGSNPEHQDRSRWFRLSQPNRHGMVGVKGLLRPDTAAKLTAALSPLAAPQPSKDVPDLRSAEQRNHDALDALAHHALATGDLPGRHGFPGKLILTARLEDLEQRVGVATTLHGGTISVRDLLRMGVDLEVIPAVFDSDGQPLHFGEEQRCATFPQRCTMWLLDGGCVFENCTIPAAWCQGAHGEEWITSRRTSIDDMGPLCGFHHRVVDNQGWELKRIDTRVWLIPPKWIDPDQTPRTNEHFRPLRD